MIRVVYIHLNLQEMERFGEASGEKFKIVEVEGQIQKEPYEKLAKDDKLPHGQNVQQNRIKNISKPKIRKNQDVEEIFKHVEKRSSCCCAW